MGKHHTNDQRDGEDRRRFPHVRTMHEDVTECDDPACCCEPEPRWRELGEQLHREAAQRSDQLAEARDKPT